MSTTGRLCLVAASMPALLALCVGVAGGAEEPQEAPPDFRAVLEQAASAYDAGNASEAHKKLREAARLVAPDEFHAMLAEAGERYDAEEPQSARLVLKRAIRHLNPWFWVILGFVAQAMFVGRFTVQWIASERRGESVMPVAFWYLSLLGSWGLLSYALWRQDIVIILGQAFNSIIYVRNLTLIYRKRRHEAVAASVEETAQ